MVSFYAADGETLLQVPIPQIDSFNDYIVSVCINYGTQLGATLAMLFVTLIMTPTAKLRRPSGVLQVLVLLLCAIRTALLAAWFLTDFTEFYNVFAMDYSSVPGYQFHFSIAANALSLMLVIAVEIVLMHQAWAMVALWPDAARYVLSILSICITLLTVGWRLAATVVSNKAVLSLQSTKDSIWISQWAVITNAISICWFCALFNAKLVAHLITNHGILPTNRSLTPMEVLVMTNGVLMIIPGSYLHFASLSFLCRTHSLTSCLSVIFAGLEFGHFANFESASLTLTSVALILPLGTLAAQRVTQRYGIISIPDNISPNGTATTLQGTNPSLRPLKKGGAGGSSVFVGSSMSSHTTTTANNTPQVSISSQCEAAPSGAGRDPIDVELGQIDHATGGSGYGQVRVNRGFEQREERLW